MLHLEDSVSETLLIPLYMKHLASQMPHPVITIFRSTTILFTLLLVPRSARITSTG